MMPLNLRIKKYGLQISTKQQHERNLQGRLVNDRQCHFLELEKESKIDFNIALMI